jgi:hypothetical protein
MEFHDSARNSITWPPDANKAPNSNTLFISKLLNRWRKNKYQCTRRFFFFACTLNKIKSTYNKCKRVQNQSINNLLNKPFDIIWEWKLGHATKSSTWPETPISDIFVSTEANNSVKEVCLTFWAIAPIAWAAATLVSQFLLWRFWETYFHKALILRLDVYDNIIAKIK